MYSFNVFLTFDISVTNVEERVGLLFKSNSFDLFIVQNNSEK